MHADVARLPYGRARTDHAWLEGQDVVLDAETGAAEPVVAWYGPRQPSNLHRYDVVTACRLPCCLRHCGPWHNNIKIIIE